MPCDFSLGMLQVGKRARPALPFVAGDGTRLPFADATFDAATISFGLRNIVDPAAGLRELRRVTKPGGRLVVCEFSHPTFAPFRTLYTEYLMRALPTGRPGGVLQSGCLRLPGGVDPGVARPGRSGVDDRRGRLALGGVAQPLRRHRRPAPRDPVTVRSRAFSEGFCSLNAQVSPHMDRVRALGCRTHGEHP